MVAKCLTLALNKDRLYENISRLLHSEEILEVI